MEAFLTRALSKIRDELKISTSKSAKRVADACSEALDSLKENPDEQNAAKYFDVLRLTCESQNANATTVALDCIQKLMAYGYLRGSEPTKRPKGSASKAAAAAAAAAAGDEAGEGDVKEGDTVPLIDVVVETICSCNDFADDGVQLQVIKALLTAITTDHCDVNEASLLRAVRSCYNIHLVSHSMVNKTTAKATLTQVLSYVFQKMEATDLALKEKQAAALSTGSSSSEELAKADAAAESSVAVVAAGDGTGGAGGGSSSSGSGGGGHWASVDHKNAWLLFRALCKLSMKDAPSYSGQSSSPDDAGGGGGGSGASGEDGGADAAAAAAAAAAADPIAVQSKALSLELILSVLRASGPAFKGSDKFVHAIRSYLCVSLLRNCTAAVPDVVDVSLQVFVQLVEHFKDHLKAEIEVFITKIFLRILDSENSTHHHKGLVLEVFHTMCQDPAALVEIFLNYDADFESTNDIFKQMVGVLSRCAKGASSFNAHAETSSFGGASRRSAAQENKLRMMGLKGLGSILKSLVQCSSNAAASASSSSTTTMTLASTPATPQRATKGQGGESSELADDAPLSPLPAGGQGMDSRSLAIGGSVPTSPSLVSGLDAVEVFDRKQRFKEEQQRGILQFNLAPKKGLAYLEERGHLKHEPREVAKFLHQLRDQLDKTQIGDYLGKEKEYAGGFCVKVLHEYIDMMEFEEMVFDEAIRHFLSGFRLPGEAQKIDRMMEKFAERYTIQNKDVFPSADTAFVLAFSIIMLNTDLHNPAIQEDRRMTKAGFRRQGEGIADGGNLPEEFLDGIYDRIKKTPISLKDDDKTWGVKPGGQDGSGDSTALGAMFGATPVEKRRQQAFHQEREDMVKASETLFQLSRRYHKGAAAAGGGAVGGAHPAAPSVGPEGVAAAGGGGLQQQQHQQLGQFRRLSVLSSGGSVIQDLGQFVKPMFDVAWGPIVGALSQCLESTSSSNQGELGGGSASAHGSLTSEEDLELVIECLETMMDAIHLSAILGMETARETLVNSLAKFTTLDAVREMKPRHVECVKALLKVAVRDGNYLCESWEPVLQCVSRLNRLAEYAANGGGDVDDPFFVNGLSGLPPAMASPVPAPPPAAVVASPSYADQVAKMMFGGGPSTIAQTPEAARLVEESNASHLLAAVDSLSEQIDHIFENSAKLDSVAIQHFVTQLSAVAHLELHSGSTKTLRGWAGAGETGYGISGSTDSNNGRGGGAPLNAATAHTPRVFSLQKLVEVAALNMDIRPRLIWSNVWGVLSNHFTAAGLHPNPKVAMFAIDSLRQLSVKFLTKDELRDFSFQRLFLRPFEAIMRDSRDTDIRELVVMSVDSIVQARLLQLRSGWKTMFAVLSLGATDRKPAIAALAFACVRRLASDHFDLLVFDFTEVVNALLAFAQSPTSDTSTCLLALKLVRKCADRLGSGGVVASMAKLDPSLKEGERPTLHGRSTAIDDNQWQLWWPLLYGLSHIVGDSRVQVRNTALEALGGTLLSYGGGFSEETWRLVFKGVIFPVMESAWTDGSQQAQVASACPAHSPEIRVGDGSSFITSSARQVFAVCVDLFAAFPENADTLLHETLSLLTESICQEIETLSRIAATALLDLVLRFPPSAPESLWDMLCDGLSAVACRPLPRPLLGVSPEESAEVESNNNNNQQQAPPTPFNGAGAALSPVKADSDESTLDAGGVPVTPLPERDADGAAATLPGGSAAGAMEDNGEEPSAMGVESPLVRRSILTQLVVTLQMQDVLRAVLEAHYLDLQGRHLKTLLDSLLSTATTARQFHAEVDLRHGLRHAKLMRFPGPSVGGPPEPLPHLLEQETKAYGVLLDTLGRFLAIATTRRPLLTQGGGGGGKGGAAPLTLTHTPSMRSPMVSVAAAKNNALAVAPATAASWVPNVRAHGFIFRRRQGNGQGGAGAEEGGDEEEDDEDEAEGEARVFAYSVTPLDEAHYFSAGLLLGALAEGTSATAVAVKAGDLLVTPWPRGGPLDVYDSASFAAAYVPVEPRKHTTAAAVPGMASASAGGAGTGGDNEQPLSFGPFAGSRLTYVFQLVLDEYALKDGRAAMARSRAATAGDPTGEVVSLQAETSSLTPLVVQVLKCLGEVSDGYLQENMGWVMPAACELIRCHDVEVRVALHHFMVSKLSPILTG